MIHCNHPQHLTNKLRQSSIIANEAQNTLDQTLRNLSATPEGLTDEEAQERRSYFGANQVDHEKAPGILPLLGYAFNNAFIWVLMALAVISCLTDYWLPARRGEQTDLAGVYIILIMVGISGLLRFWQEYRSYQTVLTLKSMVPSGTTVLRRDYYGSPPEQKLILLADLVPGDIIILSPGDRVPADVRLITSRELIIDQAILTGEASAVEKQNPLSDGGQKSAAPACSADQGILDLASVCLMGTCVASGTATAVVVATGGHTYLGSLASSVIGRRTATAFDHGVNRIGRLLIRFMLLMMPVVLLIAGFTKGDWPDAWLFALALGVGLTPEMLPMIVSANLAKGAIAMAAKKAVVKQLNAIVNLGAMDVLCTDKTGTLTQDRLILVHYLNVKGQSDSEVLHLAWLNSVHQAGVKNPMDKAVITFAHARPDIERLGAMKKIDALPFDFNRRRQSIAIEDHLLQERLIVKGAVQEMLSIASYQQRDGNIVPLDAISRAALSALADSYHQDGFRVLMLATREFGRRGCPFPLTTAEERDMVIQGLLVFCDPPKESAYRALTALQQGGVQVKVLTGDNAVITGKLCRDVGLEPGEPLCGGQIELMDDDQLARAVEQRTVFTRLTPLQKSRVLQMLQANGHTVGFLGDGINDAPALRHADVGISVDTGTDIAKESAAIILLEKNLLVLEQGVIIGRATFGNIIKYLNITASSNFGNVLSILMAGVFLPFLPMLAIQLLLQNLLYDISQLALPWDRLDEEFLRQPRKWDAGNVARFMLCIGPISSIFDITTFGLMWHVFAANTVEHQALFQSGWFVEALLSQIVVVHMLRSQNIPFIQSIAARPVLLSSLLVMAFALYLPFSTLGPAIGLQPLPWNYFPWLAATLIAYCLVVQEIKQIYIRRFGTWL